MMLLIEDTQIKETVWLENLNILVKYGWVPGLFDPEDLGVIVDKLSEEIKESMEHAVNSITQRPKSL